MTEKQQLAVFTIGEWTFDPRSDEIARAGEKRALEYRAARLLNLLSRRRGDVVSREEIVGEIWQGRTLSDHSVAVVISDLRKALGDDAKSPRFIETVAKRGYRLLAEEIPAAAVPPPIARSAVSRRAVALGAVALASAALVTGAIMLKGSPAGAPRTIIAINEIENATGAPQYDALAATVGEFAADQLSARAGGSLLIRDFNNGKSWKTNKTLERWFGRRSVIYHLSGKIVLDAGAPYVVFAVADGRDWSIAWTASVAVEPNGVAPAVRSSLNSFLNSIGRFETAPAKTADAK